MAFHVYVLSINVNSNSPVPWLYVVDQLGVAWDNMAVGSQRASVELNSFIKDSLFELSLRQQHPISPLPCDAPKLPSSPHRRALCTRAGEGDGGGVGCQERTPSLGPAARLGYHQVDGTEGVPRLTEKPR